MTREDLTTIAGHAFIVTDRLGDITQTASRGLFVADTRFLSHYALRLNGAAPVLLRSGMVGHNRAQVYATNTMLGTIADHTLGLSRRRILGGVFAEEIELSNYGRETIELDVTIAVDVDFADIFEVRAFLTDEPPRRATGRIAGQNIVYSNRSPKQKRQTRIRFSERPDAVSPGLASFRVQLQPSSVWKLEVTVEWVVPHIETTLPVPLQSTHREEPLAGWLRDAPVLETEDDQLRLAYDRSIRDMAILELALSSGHAVPAAGVPWYLAIFGRDAIISSLQTLPIAPRFAVGTLRTLAAYQATRTNDFRDAEPGKMPHEVRFGALAQSDSVPHARYYGTVDATPLWLILLVAIYAWIGDRTLVEEMLPAARRALRWIDEFGDVDGDGFVEYQTRSRHGLVNQGWKDSWDGIRFADGRIAEPPIALIEVQGYAYAAKLAIAGLDEHLGLHEEEAAALRSEAVLLKERVQDAFWMPGEECYALALDGQKRQVDGIASNQGHLLWTGLPDREQARSVVQRLMATDSFSGWGIRTLAASMTGYNPFGYHTGTVWPHDTALIAAGFRRYGFDQEMATLASGLIDATQWFEDQRLPELFCGYDRGATPFPVDYPVACSPQAWSAGATIMLVTELAGLAPTDAGLRVDPVADGRELRLSGVPFRGHRYDIDTGAPSDRRVVRSLDRQTSV